MNMRFSMLNKILYLILFSPVFCFALSLEDGSHLLRRTEFGPSVESLDEILNKNRAQAVSFVLNKNPRINRRFRYDFRNDYERHYNNRVDYQSKLDSLKLRLKEGRISKQEFQTQKKILLKPISYQSYGPEGLSNPKIISKSYIRKGLINLDSVLQKIVRYESAVQALPPKPIKKFKMEHKKLAVALVEDLIEDYRKFLFLTEDNNNDKTMEPHIKKKKEEIMGYISRYNIKKAFVVFSNQFLNADYLQALWIDKMLDSPAPIQEVMTVFWHDHFATKIRNKVAMAYQNHTLRKHALGSFKEMLYDMSEDKALFKYLNASKNMKERPNENFARELLELFTLGEKGGHYTEADVKSAARALTGYHIHPAGKNSGLFVFYPERHDSGEKTFLGQTGNFNKRDIIDILLNQKQTARYLMTKLWLYFVSPEPNSSLINQWADEFYNSDYNIKLALQKILTSSVFYSSKGLLIKNPMDFLVGTARTFKYKKADNILKLSSQANGLGQSLFRPPNVSGWKGGVHWINPISLTKRRKILKRVLFSKKESKQLANQRENFTSLAKPTDTASGWGAWKMRSKTINSPSVQTYTIQNGQLIKIPAQRKISAVKVKSSNLFKPWINFFKSRGENQAWKTVLLPIPPQKESPFLRGVNNGEAVNNQMRGSFQLGAGNLSYQLVDSYLQDVVYQLK